MKIAVFIYGEFREFDTVIKYWDFLDKINHDIYLSTWDYSLQINEKLGIFREKHINEDMIKSILPNCEFSILKESDYFEDTEDIKIKNRSWRVSVHWKKCLELLEKSGKEYDFIMLTRTDNFTIYRLNDELLSQLNRIDTVYGLSYIYLQAPKKFFVQDMFFLGDFKIMSNFIKTFPEYPISLHEGISEHIMDLNLYIEPIGHVNVTAFRPNCLGLKHELTFDDVANKHIQWQNTQSF